MRGDKIMHQSFAPHGHGQFHHADCRDDSFRASCGCTRRNCRRCRGRFPPARTGNSRRESRGQSRHDVQIRQCLHRQGQKRPHAAKSTSCRRWFPPMTDAERARGMAAAKPTGRPFSRAIAPSCHAKVHRRQIRPALYDAVCAVCHEGNPRASMVPDLHNLKDPTNDEFWRTWIAHGKAGTLMPAFSPPPRAARSTTCKSPRSPRI
jgi:mono/diheme cytochrome c family protein